MSEGVYIVGGEIAIEEPDYSKAPPVAYSHWYGGDLTLEQAEEMFPLGCTVRFYRGGGRLLGGMTGRVVGHFQDKDAVMTRFGGRAGIQVDIGSGAQEVADLIGVAIGGSMRGLPVQKISNPFRSCERIENPQ